MKVIPAIDILDGQVVRLRRGDYEQRTVYESAPADHARALRAQTDRLHVVDLEGARSGHPSQLSCIRSLIEAFGDGVQVGGGIRTDESVEQYLDLGASRVVLGTSAIRDIDLVSRMATRYPDRVIVALDAKDGKVATDGWEQLSEHRVADVAARLSSLPLSALLYTDIARDGTEVGPNVEATSALASLASVPVIASGGIGTLLHIRALAAAGIAAAVVGRALYEGRFTLADAIKEAQQYSSPVR